MDSDNVNLGEQPFICETINWTNGTGLDITEFQIHSGTPPDGYARFRIGVTLLVDGKPAVQKMAPIPAETLEEAFAIAPQVIEGAQPEMLETLKAAIREKQGGGKPRIVTAAEARAAGHNGNRQQRRADAAQHNRMRGNF